MKRPGRFARQVFVPPPDVVARTRIIELALESVPHGPVDVAAIARDHRAVLGCRRRCAGGTRQGIRAHRISRDAARTRDHRRQDLLRAAGELGPDHAGLAAHRAQPRQVRGRRRLAIATSSVISRPTSCSRAQATCRQLFAIMPAPLVDRSFAMTVSHWSVAICGIARRGVHAARETRRICRGARNRAAPAELRHRTRFHRNRNHAIAENRPHARHRRRNQIRPDRAGALHRLALRRGRAREQGQEVRQLGRSQRALRIPGRRRHGDPGLGRGRGRHEGRRQAPPGDSAGNGLRRARRGRRRFRRAPRWCSTSSWWKFVDEGAADARRAGASLLLRLLAARRRPRR